MCRRIRLVITLVITHYHMTKGVSIRKIGLILLLCLQRDSRQVEISRVVRSTGVMVESPCSDHDYLNLITRSTEIWYQNRHTGSNRCEICCPFPPLSGTERGYKIHLSSFTCRNFWNGRGFTDVHVVVALGMARGTLPRSGIPNCLSLPPACDHCVVCDGLTSMFANYTASYTAHQIPGPCSDLSDLLMLAADRAWPDPL
jgi:hypothetical protein